MRTLRIYCLTTDLCVVRRISCSHHGTHPISGAYLPPEAYASPSCSAPSLRPRPLVPTRLLCFCEHATVLLVFSIPHLSDIIEYCLALTDFMDHSAFQIQPCCCKWYDFLGFSWLSNIPVVYK